MVCCGVMEAVPTSILTRTWYPAIGLSCRGVGGVPRWTGTRAGGVWQDSVGEAKIAPERRWWAAFTTLVFFLLTTNCTHSHGTEGGPTVSKVLEIPGAQERRSKLIQSIVRQEYVSCLEDIAPRTDEERALLAICYVSLREQREAASLILQVEPGSKWRDVAEAVVGLSRAQPSGAPLSAESSSMPALNWLVALLHTRLSHPDDAVRVIEDLLERVKDPFWRAELLVLMAEALQRRGERERGREVLKSALQEHGESVRALVSLSLGAIEAGDFEGANEFAARAVGLAPRSSPARFAYWKARIRSDRGVPPGWLDSQAREFAEFVAKSASETFFLAEELEARGESELAFSLFEFVTLRFARSSLANSAHYRAARILVDNPGLRKDSETAELLASYLARSDSDSAMLRTDACYWLFDFVARGEVPQGSPSLEHLAQCGSAPEATAGHVLQRKNEIAVGLAGFSEQRELARELALGVIESLTDAQKEIRPNNILARAHLALALVAAQGSEERELLVHAEKSLSLVSTSREVDFRTILARLLIRQEKASLASSFAEGCLQHPDCVEAASLAYEIEYGSLTGFGGYLRKKHKQLLVDRQKMVLGTAKQAVVTIPLMDLVDVHGEPGDLPSQGALAIGFWNIDCAPCRWEMPEFQSIVDAAERKQNHTVISVNVADSPERVRKWMDEEGYNFPVYFLKGESPVREFPTVWFVNRQRNLVFETTGLQEKTWFEIESSWRMDFIEKGHE